MKNEAVKTSTFPTRLNRRNFITQSAAAIAATAIIESPVKIFSPVRTPIKAIAFDAFPIFNPGPVFALAEKLFPEKGKQLNIEWRTKQFEYTWLRTAAGQYKDFRKVTEDALVYAAKKHGITLTDENRNQLMQQYLTLNCWDDVLPVLTELKQRGLQLVFLSNMTVKMLLSCSQHAGIKEYFDAFISTDELNTYKPDPKAYQAAVKQLNLRKEEILFTAFAGWDAAGAKWFGYPTFWVNRLETPAEELDIVPDGQGKGMKDLLNFITRYENQ